MIPLLVTRAADEAAALVARLGPAAVAAPCLAFEPLAPPRPDLPGADLLVASPRAVGPLATVGLDPSWRVLALAPATAAVMHAAGLPVHLAVPGGGATLAAAARPGPVICATSDLGGDEVLRVRPDAVRWVLYRTVCPDALPAAAVAALDGPFDVLFTSPSAVRNFDRLAPGALARARRVLCHGATTLAEVETFGGVGELTTLP
ncbi:MAG: uroporphyrinogen-III synthase [Pseudomonadota bacterium]|nr:uroporphyrinogen-III synthase [Pseudomonadota bacterium]